MIEESTKQKIVVLMIDKLIIAIIIALVGWYIESHNKRLDNELAIQREAFLGNLKAENDKVLRQMEQTFQSQQRQKQQDFELQLEKFRTNTNYSNDFKKTRIDNQRIAFAHLMALKIPFGQAIRTSLEAEVTSKYYDRRYNLFTHDQKDFDASEHEYQRLLLLSKDISNLQKEIFEELGSIQANFQMNKNLRMAIDNFYDYKSLGIALFPINFNNEAELSAYLKLVVNSIDSRIVSQYTTKIEKILTLLKPQVTR